MKTFALLVLLLAGVPAARACTVKEILQPQILVEQAQSIYHVKAVGYVVPLQQLPRGQAPKVRFTLLGAVKGAAPIGPLQFAGVLVQTDDRNDQTVPYDFVRPAGRHGMCFATEYRAGAEYLMLIKGGTPYWARLSPTNEQLFGPTDAWLKWVKQQAAQSSKVARWTLPAEQFKRFCEEEQRIPAKNIMVNFYKPPKTIPAEGVEVIFSDGGVLIGDGYFPLSTKGGRRLQSVRHIASDPPSIEFGTVMNTTVRTSSATISSHRTVGSLRVPVAADARRQAGEVVDRYQSIIDRQ